MGKNAFFIGQPILLQVLKLIPRDIVEEASKKFQSDRYVKSFTTYHHLVSMLYASLTNCQSLRELVTGLQVSHNKLLALGIDHTPRRSTIADANARRTEEIFEYIFHNLVKKHINYLPDSRTKPDTSLEDRLFIIDSSTITLFSNIIHGAGSYCANGKKKGGVKAHMLVKAAEDIPVFVRITEGKANDQNFMPHIKLPRGSYLVMDKAYANSNMLFKWDEKEMYWVSRMRHGSSYKVVKQLALTNEQRSNGIISDQIIRMGRASNKSTKILIVRLVVYWDKEKNRIFYFTSNDFAFSAELICDLYKKRWQIELIFKRWKTHSPLRYFLGDSPNAIKIQIWCSLIAELLIQIVRLKINKGKRKWSFANLSGLLKHHMFSYIDMYQFLANPEKSLLIKKKNENRIIQLNLFNST
jgi:transposase